MLFSASYSENPDIKPSNLSLYALRQKFYSLFPQGWDFIVKETPESEWKTVKKYKLTEQKLWYKYRDSEQIIGLRFGNYTRHGLCDIDIGSIHDPRKQEESLTILKGELEKWGITRIFFLQSSFSEGLHFYFFFDRLVNTFRLACAIRKAIEDAGLSIKRGQLETFPNTKRYDSLFNGHRLPLQQGSCLLDKDYIFYSDAIEDFIDAAEWSAAGNDTDLLESRLDEAYEWFKAQKNQQRIYNPTPEDKDFIEQVEYAQREILEGFLNKIRLEVEQGFTGNGETNELLLTIAKLGRILYGLSGQPYINYIKETVTGCPGYYKYCRHKHEIDRRCREVARYGEKQWYPYRSRLPEDRPTYKYIKDNLTNKTNLNLERQHNARSRIIQAVAHLEENGTFPRSVGQRKLAIRNFTKEVFGVSISDATLTKASNLPLWHPKHRAEDSEDVVRHPAPNDNTIQEITATPTEDGETSLSDIGAEVEAESAGTPSVEIAAPFISKQDTLEKPKPIREELTTEESKAACDCELTDAKTQCSIEPDNTIEPNKTIEASKEVNRFNRSQETNQIGVAQQQLHSEQPHSIEDKDRATPCYVARQTQLDPETLNCLPSLVSTILCHTLPHMKGIVLPLALAESIYLLLQRTYFSFLMGTPGLELSYQGYRGYAARGLVRKKGIKQAKLKLIPFDSEVEVLREDYHSFCYRDNPKQLLVYIKPKRNAEDWLNGIAVLVEHLVPLRITTNIYLELW